MRLRFQLSVENIWHLRKCSHCIINPSLCGLVANMTSKKQKNCCDKFIIHIKIENIFFLHKRLVVNFVLASFYQNDVLFDYSIKMSTLFSKFIEHNISKSKQAILFHKNKIHTLCPFPTPPLLENKSQYELDAARRCPFLFSRKD